MSDTKELIAAKAHAADLQGEIARLQEALRISKLRNDDLQQQRDAAKLLAEHRFEERDRIAIRAGVLEQALRLALPELVCLADQVKARPDGSVRRAIAVVNDALAPAGEEPPA
jgi:hypothetical protein